MEPFTFIAGAAFGAVMACGIIEWLSPDTALPEAEAESRALAVAYCRTITEGADSATQNKAWQAFRWAEIQTQIEVDRLADGVKARQGIGQ